MRHAWAKQTAAGGLEHDAHARAHLAQACQILRSHDPWIGVGQQRCVVQDELAHLHQIVQRAAVSIALQLLAHGGKEGLRFIAQAK